jgi:hypothetical protein
MQALHQGSALGTLQRRYSIGTYLNKMQDQQHGITKNTSDLILFKIEEDPDTMDLQI